MPSDPLAPPPPPLNHGLQASREAAGLVPTAGAASWWQRLPALVRSACPRVFRFTPRGLGLLYTCRASHVRRPDAPGAACRGRWSEYSRSIGRHRAAGLRASGLAWTMKGGVGSRFWWWASAVEAPTYVLRVCASASEGGWAGRTPILTYLHGCSDSGHWLRKVTAKDADRWLFTLSLGPPSRRTRLPGLALMLPFNPGQRHARLRSYAQTC